MGTTLVTTKLNMLAPDLAKGCCQVCAVAAELCPKVDDGQDHELADLPGPKRTTAT